MAEEQMKKLEADLESILESHRSSVEIIRERIRELEDDLVLFEANITILSNLICELKKE